MEILDLGILQLIGLYGMRSPPLGPTLPYSSIGRADILDILHSYTTLYTVPKGIPLLLDLFPRL
jgi:hypothetical protein